MSLNKKTSVGKKTTSSRSVDLYRSESSTNSQQVQRPHGGHVSALSQLEDELVQLDKSNSQLQLSVSELRLRLRAKEGELRKEMQKVSTYLGE